MKTSPTEKQVALFRAIVVHRTLTGRWPTTREMAEATGASSESAAREVFERLLHRGVLAVPRAGKEGKYRSLHLLSVVSCPDGCQQEVLALASTLRREADELDALACSSSPPPAAGA
jgi:SOS-response transcriptional repressor LexA